VADWNRPSDPSEYASRAPRHDVVVAAFDVVRAASARREQRLGDGAREAGFLGDEETHR
jgi:hypothetical protein